jgi:hypothetical protein
MAIWNKVKVVVLVALAIWLADVGFLITGEYRPSTDHRGISNKPGGITGAARVKFSTLTVLDLLGLLAHCRSVIRGRQSARTVSCSTHRA